MRDSRPSRLLITVSLIVIGGCLLLIALGIATLLSNSGRPSTPFALAFVTLPYLTVLAVQQYRGTFRSACDGSGCAAALLLLVTAASGFFLMAVIMSAQQMPLVEILPMAAAMGGVLLVSGAGAWLNIKWTWALPLARPDKSRVSLAEIMAIVTALAVLFGATAHFMNRAAD